ncbi:hypothetical protein GC56T2_0008 [Geobacillus sp. C56-T2]|nr:hypothetical protein GC56T2_0008 [Geobacillus sp. C56-T2]
MGTTLCCNGQGASVFMSKSLSMHPKSCYDKRYKRREKQTDGSRKPFPAS